MRVRDLKTIIAMFFSYLISMLVALKNKITKNVSGNDNNDSNADDSDSNRENNKVNYTVLGETQNFNNVIGGSSNKIMQFYSAEKNVDYLKEYQAIKLAYELARDEKTTLKNTWRVCGNRRKIGSVKFDIDISQKADELLREYKGDEKQLASLLIRKYQAAGLAYKLARDGESTVTVCWSISTDNKRWNSYGSFDTYTFDLADKLLGKYKKDLDKFSKLVAELKPIVDSLKPVHDRKNSKSCAKFKTSVSRNVKMKKS